MEQDDKKRIAELGAEVERLKAEIARLQALAARIGDPTVLRPEEL